jgi:hypothetical protein
MAMSASLPCSSEPIRSSSPTERALSIVAIRSACAGVIAEGSSLSWFWKSRTAFICSTMSTLVSTIGPSDPSETVMPASSIRRTGVMPAPRDDSLVGQCETVAPAAAMSSRSRSLG